MRATGILDAVRTLRCGGVIAYPTEACFGLGCDPRNRRAVFRILTLKHRSPAQGLILVAASLAQLRPYLDASCVDLLSAPMQSWPGPVTWLLPASRWTPPWITGSHSSVAVRISAEQNVARLCRAFGGAIVSTSANPHRLPPARNMKQVTFYFGRRVDVIVRGSIGKVANPTEIRDAASGTIVRPG